MTDVLHFLQEKTIHFRDLFVLLRDNDSFKRWSHSIIKKSHPVLPDWVKKNLFYQDMRGRILYLSLICICPDLFHSNTSNSSLFIYISNMIDFPIISYYTDFPDDSHTISIPIRIRELLDSTINMNHLRDHPKDIYQKDSFNVPIIANFTVNM
jgi:hypothetical protein